MNRRESIKLIIASAIAPAFVAKGLMKVKPIIMPTKTEIIEYGGIKMIVDPAIVGDFIYVVHPHTVREHDLDRLPPGKLIESQYVKVDEIIKVDKRYLTYRPFLESPIIQQEKGEQDVWTRTFRDYNNLFHPRTPIWCEENS